MSLDAKEAGDLFRFPASFVLVINIQNAFDLTQVGFWDCIYRVKSQDDLHPQLILLSMVIVLHVPLQFVEPKQDPAMSKI